MGRGCGNEIVDEGRHIGERLDTSNRGVDALCRLGAIALAAAAQLWWNFSIWVVRVIGSAGCPYITSIRSLSLHPSRSVISTVTGTRAFGSRLPSTMMSTRRAVLSNET